MTVLWQILVFLTLSGHFISAIEDYCSSNTLKTDSNDMHFTKERISQEYAFLGKFKGLHCCAKGYKSIEWFKDGQPYPWRLDLSNFIIFPESTNQTIYAQNIRDNDTGNYTCVLRNDRGNETEIFKHDISLRVFDKLPDEPKITYVSNDMEVFAGDAMRLFCEAFGGTVDLPDARSEAVWYKKLSNGTSIEVPEEITQEKTSREEGQIFGTYLNFAQVKPEDFGTYTCVITKPGNSINTSVTITRKEKVILYIDRNPFPIKEVIIISLLSVVVLTTVLLLIRQYGLKVQVLLKDNYGPIEENDGKTSDVLIAFSPKDAEHVVGVMIPNLEARSYHCVSKELTPDISNWSEELSHQAQTCRRLLVVLSPAALNDSWASSNLYQALKQLQAISAPKLICVMLKELPACQNETKNSLGETLSSVSKSMNIISWERSNGAKFWLEVCKQLPAKRADRPNLVEMTQQQSRPRLTSERSLDSLMVV